MADDCLPCAGSPLEIVEKIQVKSIVCPFFQILEIGPPEQIVDTEHERRGKAEAISDVPGAVFSPTLR